MTTGHEQPGDPNFEGGAAYERYCKQQERRRLDEITVDPGDGSTPVPLEYVLIRGFTAMGWERPASAAGDMLDAIASVALAPQERP